jgi:hypothetical protein
MKIPRRIEQEEGVIPAIRRIRSPRIDRLIMKEKCQGMKIDIPKKIFYLEEKVVPLTESEPVTVENKEEKIVQPTPPSKSTSPTK